MSLIPPVVHDVPTDAIFAAAFAGVAPTDGVIVNYAGVLYIRNAGIWSSVGGMSTTIPSTGTASAPVAGSWLSGQLAIDSSERIWFCTVSGTPGTWVLTDTVGVSTFNTRTGAVTLLKADVTGTGLAPSDIAAAPLVSPGLTGTPTAPTASALDNSTKLATTAYADAAVAVVNALVTEIETDLGELAPLASPALTGTPTVPTAAPGTNTTQAASTAFVEAALPAAGNILLAAVSPTDATTASPSANYVAFGSAWTASVTTTALADVIVTVTITWKNSTDSAANFAIMRGGTQVFNTGILYLSADGTRTSTATFVFVDKALAVGTYTYEVRAGNTGATTTTVYNNTATTPTVAAKGGSVMTIEQAASV